MEIRGQKEDKTENVMIPPGKAVEIADRYKQETQKLRKKRQDARKDLTPESLLELVGKKELEGLPDVRTLVSWYRSVEKRIPGTADRLFPELLDLWQRYHDKKEELPRARAIEALLTRVSISVDGQLRLTETQWGRLWEMLEFAAMSGKRSAGALLLVVSRFGDRSCVEKLRALKEKASLNRQFLAQLDGVIQECNKREIAHAGH